MRYGDHMGASANGIPPVVWLVMALIDWSLTHVNRLLFQIISIASDMVFFKTKENFPSTYIDDTILKRAPAFFSGGSLTSKVKDFFKNIDISRVVVPLLFTTMSAVIVSVVFTGAGNTYRDEGNACSTKPDADISGVGVRASIWGQIGMLILISGCGYFHKKETAIKEVAGGLILTHVSLAIAIIVQMYKKTLTSVDAAIGAAILDAQNVALHIPVAAKQTLAARWQVLILIPAQILGLAFLPLLVIKFIMGSFASEDCKCFGFFWWSHFSDCEVIPSSELSLFWIYYSLRWIMWVQAFVHSMYNAESFHRSEKEGRIPVFFTEKGLEDNSKEARARERQEYPKRTLGKATIQSGLLYKEYPATTSVSSTTYAVYSVTSMAVAEVTIRKYTLQPVSQVNSIGQIIAMVVALATFIRVIWSFQSLYNRFENNSFPDLVFNPRKSWPKWCCCVDSKENGTGDGQASTSPKQDGEDSWKEADTDSGNHGSGRRRSSQHTAPLTPPKCEAYSQHEQYAQQYPQSPALRNGRPSLDATDISKTMPYSPLEQDSRIRHILPGQPKMPPQRSHSYEPGYRFEFQQPFHLDAVKQLFLPTFTQYLEDRKEDKVTVPTSDILTTPPFEPTAIDQPTAYTLPGQSRGSIGKGKAPLPLLVENAPHQAEASTSRDNQHPVKTGGKPPDSIGAKMIPEIDNSVVIGQSGQGPELEDSQPQLATRRDMTPASISTRPGPQEHQPIASQKSGKQQLGSLPSWIHATEEGLPEPPIVSEGPDSPEQVDAPTPAPNSLREIVWTWRTLKTHRELRDRSKAAQSLSEQVPRDLTPARINWQRVIPKIRHLVQASKSGGEGKSAVTSAGDALPDSTPIMLSAQGPLEDERVPVSIDDDSTSGYAISGDEQTHPLYRSASTRREVNRTLKDWLTAHQKHPYPSDSEIIALQDRTGLDKAQLKNWFAITRQYGRELESDEEYPDDIADQSKAGREPQQPEAQSKKDCTLAWGIASPDTGSETKDPQSTWQSGNLEYRKRLQLELARLSSNKMKSDLSWQSRGIQATLQWDLLLNDLGLVPYGKITPDYLKRKFARRWERMMWKRREKRVLDEVIFDMRRPRSGCPGRGEKCEQSGTVWEDQSSFVEHFFTHTQGFRPFDFLTCHECGSSISPVSVSGSELNRLSLPYHIWREHMHVEHRDPSSPPPAAAEQDKGKLAEASKLELSQRVDAERGDLQTTTQRTIFRPHSLRSNHSNHST